MTCGSLHRIFSLSTLLVIITIPTACFAKTNSHCPDNAQQFWKEFRTAAMQSNVKKIANMVQFPLEVRGTMDDSPSRQMKRDKFKNILPKLLATDPGMSAIPGTMKSYIQNIETVQKKACNKHGNQFRIGTWVFVKKNADWLLVQAFIEE